MSRSYRKPYAVCGYGGCWKPIAKRQAAKRVRKAKDVSDFMSYKRLFNQWDICDYKFLVKFSDDEDWHKKLKRK